MRRFVAILLLALLSLQSTWAVAAAYCQHEAKRDAAHFGHHAGAQVEAATPTDGGDSGVAEGHCHDCHAAGVYLVLPAAPAHGDVTGPAPLHAAAPWLPAPPASPPERPDWQALA